MQNFEPILGPQLWSEGQGVNNLYIIRILNYA